MNSETRSEAETMPSAAPSRRGIALLIAAVVVVVLALLIGVQVIGVLYGIIFPAQPPRPPDLTELSHSSTSYGVDDWEYGTSQDACQVARYYQSNDGNCTFSPKTCDAGFIDPTTVESGDNVAQCTGTVQFSIFAMRWNAIVATGYKDGYPTHFKLSREVFWTGEVPPSFLDVIDEMPTSTPNGEARAAPTP